MRHTVRGFVLMASIAVPTTGFADTFRTFNLKGTLQSGGTASGSITVDTTSGFLSSGNVNVSANNATFNFTYLFMQNAVGGSPPTEVDAYFLYIIQNTVTGTDLNLLLPESLVNYQGGSLCSTSLVCAGGGYGSSFTDTLVNGIPATDYFTTISATSTPEPAAWLCVITGLVAVVGKVRRQAAERSNLP